MIRTMPVSLAAATLCLAAVAQPSAAQTSEASQAYKVRQQFYPSSPQIVRKTHVRYSDIDLSSPTGLKILLDRIEGAADAVCVRYDDTDRAKHEYKECRLGAISDAVRGVHSPSLKMLASRSREALLAAK
jgi:UrcA family protein